MSRARVGIFVILFVACALLTVSSNTLSSSAEASNRDSTEGANEESYVFRRSWGGDSSALRQPNAVAVGPDRTFFLAESIDKQISHKLYYGHFMCHVFHQDYIVRKGNNCTALEHEMLELLDQRGAQYPAEHNVGHLYKAKPALQQFYRQLDPTNSLNPGIGKTSKKKYWA